MVWMPPATGSHTGGRWVEVDENASSDTGALNVKRGSAEALHREQMQNAGDHRACRGVETARVRDLPRVHHLT